MYIKKKKGKSAPIKIDNSVREAISKYKARLQEMADSPDEEVREIDKISLSVILKELDSYDRNVLLSYYALPDMSVSDVARMLGVSPSILVNKVNKIKQNVRDRAYRIAIHRGVRDGYDRPEKQHKKTNKRSNRIGRKQ
mgnify:CR=1 FL=1